MLSCQQSSLLDGLPRQTVSGPDQLVPQGTVARTRDYDLLVTTLAECSTCALPDGRRTVGVLMTIEARGAEQLVPANPYYALLIGSRGEVYEATLGGCTPVLAARLLGTGESARGWISFEVPLERTGSAFAYAPPGSDGERQEIVFELPP